VWGCGVVGGCSSPGRRPSFSVNPGKFSGSPQNPGNRRQGILGFLRHQTASFMGAPITAGKSCHVTQPGARVNVSCSRAATGGPGGEGCEGCEGCKGCKGWVPDLGARPGCQTWVPDLGARPGCQTWVPDLGARPGCPTRAGQGRRENREGQQIARLGITPPLPELAVP
jgi:hypothetical protein